MHDRCPISIQVFYIRQKETSLAAVDGLLVLHAVLNLMVHQKGSFFV